MGTMKHPGDSPAAPPSGDEPDVLMRDGTTITCTAIDPGSSSDSQLLGRLFGPFKVIDQLGAGGMARVYLATHTEIGGRFAVKILNTSSWDLRESVGRCLREAQSAAKIRHPNVVRVIHAGRTDDDLVFVVMDFVEGKTLEDVLRQYGPLPWARLGPIALQLCRGLAAAHRNGVIHRDVKPSNCILDSAVEHTDHIKVIDFGIAKPTTQRAHEVITEKGVVLGTPEYMAPEYAEGEAFDARVDIYALGVTLYKLVTGVLPLAGTSFAGIMYQHVHTQPDPPTERAPHLSIPPAVDTILLKALAKRPEDRFASMQEMAKAISQAMIGVAPWTPTQSFPAVADDPEIRSEPTRAEQTTDRPEEHTSSSNRPDAPSQGGRPARTVAPASLSYILVRLTAVAAAALFFVYATISVQPPEPEIKATSTRRPKGKQPLEPATSVPDPTSLIDAATHGVDPIEQPPEPSPVAPEFNEQAVRRLLLQKYQKTLNTTCNPNGKFGQITFRVLVSASGQITSMKHTRVSFKSPDLECIYKKIATPPAAGESQTGGEVFVTFTFE